ncbi:MAG: TFIIB-type zinc ribbon-containing protein, partial [Candidatus Thorarchaeota archaeon]
MSRRGLRFSKTTCPICGSKEVARDDLKGDLLCTNCGQVITRRETRAVGKFEVAKILRDQGRMDFPKLRDQTGASDDKLFGV